jgi:hypothetical protein
VSAANATVQGGQACCFEYGNNVQAVAEIDACFAVVKHNTASVTPSRRLLKLAQATQIALGDRGRRLDLGSCYLSGAALDHDIHLEVVAIAEVKERQRLAAPACLPPEFLKNESLDRGSGGATDRARRALSGFRHRRGTRRCAARPCAGQALPGNRPLHRAGPGLCRGVR